MNSHIALLRAVNVGGTGKLPMAELKLMCEELGFSEVRTYIASGNVIFRNSLSAEKTRQLLEEKLHTYAGKPVGVIMVSPAEMQAVLNNNPFKECAPNRTIAIFLTEAPPSDCIAKAKHHNNEEIVVGDKLIYVHYGDGMASSKLLLPAAKNGTARNMNTVTKLVEFTSNN